MVFFCPHILVNSFTCDRVHEHKGFSNFSISCILIGEKNNQTFLIMKLWFSFIGSMPFALWEYEMITHFGFGFWTFLRALVREKQSHMSRKTAPINDFLTIELDCAFFLYWIHDYRKLPVMLNSWPWRITANHMHMIIWSRENIINSLINFFLYT